MSIECSLNPKAYFLLWNLATKNNKSSSTMTPRPEFTASQSEPACLHVEPISYEVGGPLRLLLGYAPDDFYTPANQITPCRFAAFSLAKTNPETPPTGFSHWPAVPSLTSPWVFSKVLLILLVWRLRSEYSSSTHIALKTVFKTSTPFTSWLVH